MLLIDNLQNIVEHRETYLKKDENTPFSFLNGKNGIYSLLCFGCDNFDSYPREDIFSTYLTKKESERFELMFLIPPHIALIDFRGWNDRLEKYFELLRIEHN